MNIRKPKGELGTSRKALPGPATLIALAVAMTLVIANLASDRRPALGHVSHLPSPTKPLYKPEPGNLLADPKLNLSSSQVRGIEKIDANWQKDRARLLAAMSAFRPKQGRLDDIDTSLKDYSVLSDQYDGARAAYWSAAIAMLTDAQRQALLDTQLASSRPMAASGGPK